MATKVQNQIVINKLHSRENKMKSLQSNYKQKVQLLLKIYFNKQIKIIKKDFLPTFNKNQLG